MLPFRASLNNDLPGAAALMVFGAILGAVLVPLRKTLGSGRANIGAKGQTAAQKLGLVGWRSLRHSGLH